MSRNNQLGSEDPMLEKHQLGSGDPMLEMRLGSGDPMSKNHQLGSGDHMLENAARDWRPYITMILNFLSFLYSFIKRMSTMLERIWVRTFLFGVVVAV